MNDDDRLIPPHGNYRELLSYRKAEIVYDLTHRFCHRFLAKTDRTIDQMIQSARSGKQNNVEGSSASGTSKETEMKLIGVAREARFVRRIGSDPDVTYERYREFCETRSIEVVANIAICLIHQTNYLLDQQVRRLERDFVREGGLREHMARARRQYRGWAEAQA